MDVMVLALAISSSFYSIDTSVTICYRVCVLLDGVLNVARVGYFLAHTGFPFSNDHIDSVVVAVAVVATSSSSVSLDDDDSLVDETPDSRPLLISLWLYPIC